MSVSFEEAFRSFCHATKINSKTATDKTLKRICTDSKLTNKKLDNNAIDITFRKFVGNAKKDVNFAEFNQFLEKYFAAEYGKSVGEGDAEKAMATIKQKIIENCPAAKGPKGPKVDSTTARLTDTSKYTGAHKERFDESGKGKGADGRSDRVENTGYVGNYKEAGSYDKKH